MPVITKITVQQKLKDRYNIFIDDGNGEKYGFSVDEDVLIKYQLKKGMELDDFTVTEIFYQDDIRKAYSQAVQYLASRMRSEAEVRQYLYKKEVAEPVINEVVHKLYQYKFLDDQEFAIAFVRTQMNTTDKGVVVIQQELKEKGIAAPTIETAILEYSYEQQFDKACELVRKYIQKYKHESLRASKQKMEQLLIRKGYPFEIIHEAIDSVEIEEDIDQEMDTLKNQAEKLQSKYRKYEGFEFRQKMKQALYRKGFPLELIDQYLTKLADEMAEK
ncbi:recombination regulator RecX [Bacillus sp. DNRA2]|uniref:recombination regulator RecX n=1 Tax=Bacillus sp. DNRA2 TaxID=2723053 RepID=UPI00145D5BDD|nr:recombination regulator RecX [Bacillus sp. DNRA2]NMD71382.1 recombination regulator RecX [Bacillus sp. DNRA2]